MLSMLLLLLLTSFPLLLVEGKEGTLVVEVEGKEGEKGELMGVFIVFPCGSSRETRTKKKTAYAVFTAMFGRSSVGMGPALTVCRYTLTPLLLLIVYKIIVVGMRRPQGGNLDKFLQPLVSGSTVWVAASAEMESSCLSRAIWGLRGYFWLFFCLLFFLCKATD